MPILLQVVYLLAEEFSMMSSRVYHSTSLRPPPQPPFTTTSTQAKTEAPSMTTVCTAAAP